MYVPKKQVPIAKSGSFLVPINVGGYVGVTIISPVVAPHSLLRQ